MAAIACSAQPETWLQADDGENIRSLIKKILVETHCRALPVWG
jgi:hypothetical protein